jgi:hypothetical protein
MSFPRAIFKAAALWLLTVSCSDSPRFFDDAGAPDAGANERMPGWRLACAARAGGEEFWNVDPGREGARVASMAPSGSVYVAGQVAEAAVFGAGEPNETQFPNDVGWSDGFVARYAPDCTLDWVRRIGGTDEDSAFDVATLDDGSVMVVGIIRSETIVFGEGEANETTLAGSSYPTTGFVAKFRSDGGLLWAVQIPQADETNVWALTVHALPDGRIVVGGTLRGTAWPGEPFEVVSETSDSSSEWDGFLAWFDADGVVENAIRIGNDVQLFTHSITALADGAVVAALPYGYTELFGKGEPNETTLHCALQEDDTDCLSLAKYDENGALAWVRDLGVVKSFSWQVKESSDGSIILVGTFSRNPTDPELSVPGFSLGQDERGFLVAKLDPDDGALEWARLGKVGTSIWIHTHGAVPMPDGGLLALTAFDPTLEFEGSDEGQKVLVSEGQNDIALVRFSKDGEILWMYRMGNEGDDLAQAGAQVDDTSLWLTGSYRSNPFVATSGHDDEIPLPLVGSSDIFLMRFDATTPPSE